MKIKLILTKCPFILLANLGCKGGEVLRHEERKVMDGWVTQLRKEIQLGMGEGGSFLNFVFGGLHYVEILITWGGLSFGEKFEINFSAEGGTRKLQCEVDFSCQVGV